jgi:hypothetical protein
MSPLRTAAAHCSINARICLVLLVMPIQPTAAAELIAGGVRMRRLRWSPRPAARADRVGGDIDGAVVLPHVGAEGELTVGAVGVRRQNLQCLVSGPSMMNARMAWWPWYHSVSGGIAYFASSLSIPTMASTSPVSHAVGYCSASLRTPSWSSRVRRWLASGGPCPTVVRARCRASLANATVISSRSATSRAEKPRTSRSTSTARCPVGQVLEHGDEGQLYAFVRLVAGLESHLRRAQHGVGVRANHSVSASGAAPGPRALEAHADPCPRSWSSTGWWRSL